MWQNGRHYPDGIFKCIFLCENVWTSIIISLMFVPRRPNEQFSIIVSDNDLASIKQQAIIWTNDGLFYWGIYASLGLNELTPHRQSAEHSLATLWTPKKKLLLYHYRDYHCGDETVVIIGNPIVKKRQSHDHLIIMIGILMSGKMIPIFKQGTGTYWRDVAFVIKLVSLHHLGILLWTELLLKVNYLFLFCRIGNKVGNERLTNF